MPGPDTALARFGELWFGAATDHDHVPPEIEPDVRERLIARPRRYGFHATLKAPFRLAASETERTLSDAVASLAERFHRFELPPLSVRSIGGFIALTLDRPCPETQALADACTMELDRFRAPLSPAERQRRRPERLTRRQREFLETWGCPYVLAEYRWHITLTDQVEAEAATHYRRLLSQMYRRIAGGPSVIVDGVALLRQKHPDASFKLIERHPPRQRG